MKRILVTGGRGFVGRHVLLPLLERGFDVHLAVRESCEMPYARCHALDLHDKGAASQLFNALRPTHLLHLAWTVKPGDFWVTRDNLDWVSTSLHLYRAFCAAGGKRLVAAGTCAEYDWRGLESGRGLEENSPCHPTTLYGAAKLALYSMLEKSAPLDDVSLGWGRIFFLYGPGEKPGRLVSGIINNLLAGKRIETTAGTQIRDFTHVADVAGAFAALCDSDVTGPINIASGRPLPVYRIISMLGELIGRTDLLCIGARPLPPDEPEALVPLVRRLQEEVGYLPHYSLEDGLRETVAWWRARIDEEKGA